MVTLNGIKGQDNAVRYLTGSLASGRISSSYLFTGPEGVGRALTARAFIKALMCTEKSSPEIPCQACAACRRLDSDDHPDMRWIGPENKRAIKIDQVRAAKEALSLKPYEGGMNVCVIEKAHLMTTEASNALLKMLEEPPGRSVIILITSKKELLLPTVISRCSQVRFRSLPVETTRDIIMRSGADLSGDFATYLAYFSQGSPGRALEMISEGVLQRREDVLALLETIAREENAVCLNWDTDEREILLEDVEMLIMMFRDIALAKEGAGPFMVDGELSSSAAYGYFTGYTTERILDIVEMLTGLRKALTGNTNPKLVAQALPGMIK
ncbi:MAG: DNA polymerase III subunit delta' [Candidatus Omnitrophica bacterium]|nr:DNA polymerase III subunit delta' [Candidatus Omnitrophota bacterium]